MNYLHKQQPIRQTTVRRLLARYRHQFQLLIVVAVVASIGAFSISYAITYQENQDLFLVNSFYTRLQEENTLLYRCVSGQSSQTDLLTANIRELSEILQQMQQRSISLTYYRRTDDLKGYLDNYRNGLIAIASSIREGASYNQLSEHYYELNHIYTLMADTFNIVFTEIMDVWHARSEKAGRITLAYMIIMAATLLLVIAISILHAGRIDEAITVPVQQLEEELTRMDLDHFENAKAIPWEDYSCTDICLLIQIYNSMISNLQEQLKLRDEYLTTRLKLQEQEVLNLQMSNELKKSQLNNLQAQINPHFLFNTLNMISHSAYMKNDRQTVSLLGITSDLLRYALDYSDKAVPLRKEIEMLGNYVFLQEKRFSDRIRFCFDLDESFHDVLVPNLILQPLLENSIIHGVSMYTSGAQVTIRTEYHPDTQMGQISIIDNGEGMDEKRLHEVDEQMRSQKTVTGKDGLCNVFLRLSLFFGQKADIRLSSTPGKQTEVAILIPCSKETIVCTES